MPVKAQVLDTVGIQTDTLSVSSGSRSSSPLEKILDGNSLLNSKGRAVSLAERPKNRAMGRFGKTSTEEVSSITFHRIKVAAPHGAVDSTQSLLQKT